MPVPVALERAARVENTKNPIADDRPSSRQQDGDAGRACGGGAGDGRGTVTGCRGIPAAPARGARSRSGRRDLVRLRGGRRRDGNGDRRRGGRWVAATAGRRGGAGRRRRLGHGLLSDRRRLEAALRLGLGRPAQAQARTRGSGSACEHSASGVERRLGRRRRLGARVCRARARAPGARPRAPRRRALAHVPRPRCSWPWRASQSSSSTAAARESSLSPPARRAPRSPS